MGQSSADYVADVRGKQTRKGVRAKTAHQDSLQATHVVALAGAAVDPAQYRARVSAVQRVLGNGVAVQLFERGLVPGRREETGQTPVAKSGEGSLHGEQSVVQRLKVSDDHVRGDIRHPGGGAKVFEDYTLDDIATRAGSSLTFQVSNAVLDGAVKDSRAAGQMDYKQLRNQTVTSEKQLSTYLETAPDDEHMYVLDGGDLHVAIRADDKKLPHPTLVGGDPDVDCAGTMRVDTEGNVIVTASSGHFRPSSENLGQRAVDKMMGKTSSTTYKKRVKGSRR